MVLAPFMPPHHVCRIVFLLNCVQSHNWQFLKAILTPTFLVRFFFNLFRPNILFYVSFYEYYLIWFVLFSCNSHLHSILRLLQNSFIGESLWSVADHFHVNRHCFSLMLTFFRRRFTCVVISASPPPPPHFWQPTNCAQCNSSYVRWRYLPKDPPIRLVSTQIYTHLGLFLVFSIWILFLILVF